MTNEDMYVNKALNLRADITKTQKELKESYNVESRYDDIHNVLHIWTENINESLNLAMAKEYVKNNLDENMISLEIGEI